MLRKYFRLPARERVLLLRALWRLGAARTGLTLFRFPLLDRWFAAAGAGSRSGERVSVERIAWSIQVAARYIPRSTCLVQALAARSLMARYGYRSELRIGVNRDSRGAFEAHAWLEYNGKAVIGELESASFTPLPPLA
ncbi:MAG: lasso peptide biosynthesis B2 protein [Bacteroidetes bacterium]|nr:lasso peptide biosynthesis B2 protein [Bacteroidota bacterium]